MTTITLKNVPDELHSRLKARAEANHRSLNREAIRCLELMLGGEESTHEELLNHILRFRGKLEENGAWATPSSIAAAIEEGRS